MSFLSDLATATGWPTFSEPVLSGSFPGDGLAAPRGSNTGAHGSPKKLTAPAPSLLDRVFPPAQSDEAHGDRVLRLPVYGSWSS